MIEDITIVTGSPEKAAAKAQAYLDQHPNASVLGTALTMKRGKPIAPEEQELDKDKKPKAGQAAATLTAIEYGPDVPVVAITLGRVF